MPEGMIVKRVPYHCGVVKSFFGRHTTDGSSASPALQAAPSIVRTPLVVYRLNCWSGQRRLDEWAGESERRESNPRLQLGKLG
jgi:hypothetical protein